MGRKKKLEVKMEINPFSVKKAPLKKEKKKRKKKKKKKRKKVGCEDGREAMDEVWLALGPRRDDSEQPREGERSGEEESQGKLGNQLQQSIEDAVNETVIKLAAVLNL